jgi:ATP-dependent Clp protease, protease subunit
MNEFNDFAVKHLGISSNTLNDYQNNLPLVTNSVTPNIVEERQLNVALLSVFDRLMMDRIIWVAGPVNERMAIIVQAQLLFLSQQDPKKTITMHIDSPGGSTLSGRSIVDVMDYIPNPVQTINTGMAASMGSVLLGAGTKGMRSSLPSSKVMLHQVSHGFQGNIQDTRIYMEQAEKENEILFKMLGEYCDKDPKQVMKDATRDKWLTSYEALKYGIIDEVITNPNKKRSYHKSN